MMMRFCKHILYDKQKELYRIDVKYIRPYVYECKMCGMKLHPLELNFLREKAYYLNTDESERPLLLKGREKIVETNLPIPHRIK